MHSFICITCGHQFAESEEPPERCPICEDDRQFVNPRGQSWMTLNQLARGHHNVFRPLEEGLTGIGTEPRFAIGQRALLVQGFGGGPGTKLTIEIVGANDQAIKSYMFGLDYVKLDPL